MLLLGVAILSATVACTKSKSEPDILNGPRTEVPSELTGNWMYGFFSMTEYWSQNPGDYLGNGLEFAFAFTFNADGTYTQYFTSSSVTSGVVTYQQSVSEGTVEVDPVSKTINTHPFKAHYKKTTNGQVEEERNLNKDELSHNSYTYTTGVEESGTDALYLHLDDTDEPLTFLRKP